MKRLLLAVAMLGALSLPAAAAQTFTTPPAESYISPVELVDNTPGDGVIRFSKRRGGIAAKQNAKLCADYRPQWLYVRADRDCPTLIVETPPPPTPDPVPPTPTPDPVTPPPASATKATISEIGELFVQNEYIAAGFNVGGGIVTTKNAPAGYRTDAAGGFLRLGFTGFPIGIKSDALAQGRAIDGFGAVEDGKRSASMLLTGYSQVPGKWVTTSSWTGKTPKVTYRQDIALIGRYIDYAVTMTNDTASPVTVTYFRSADPDQAGYFDTANRVVAPGTVEAGLTGGGTFFLSTDYPGAYVATTTYDKAPDIGTRRDVGYSVKSDAVIQLVFPTLTLAGYQSATINFRQGFR